MGAVWARRTAIVAGVAVLAVMLSGPRAVTETVAAEPAAPPPPLSTVVQGNGLDRGGVLSSSLDELSRIDTLSTALRRPLTAATSLTPVLDGMKAAGRLRIDDTNAVQVFVTYEGEPAALPGALAALGFRERRADASAHIIQGSIPIASLAAAAQLPGVASIREPDYPRYAAGSVTTQGDQIMRADQLRARLGSDGTGVRVGVVSNGLYGLASSQSSGNSPAVNMSTCNVDGGSPTAAAAGSEGTAMIEIIHDIAPGAEIWFGYDGAGTAGGGTVLDFMAAVNCLAAHVDVVVDDVGFFNVGPYDGTSIVSANASAALNNPANPIRGYYTAVGNSALTHYKETYFSSGAVITGSGSDSWTLQGFQQTPRTSDWNTGLACPPGAVAGVRCGNTVVVAPFGVFTVALSWNDPWGSSTNDYDLLLVDAYDGSTYLASANRQSGAGANPSEIFSFQNLHPATTAYYVLIGNYKGLAAPRSLDLFLDCSGCQPITSGQFFNFDTVGESVTNNADAGSGVMSLGAAGITALNNGPLTVQPYSSRGPTADGRMKPDATAPDAVAVSGAGGFPTTFSGSSASSAHGAAVAALLLSCNPALLASSGNDPAASRAALRNALLSMARRPSLPSPPDNVQGYGLLDVESSTAPARCAPTITRGPSFKVPNALAVDPQGRVYVAALSNCQVFRLDDGGPVVVAGTGATQQPGCLFSGEGGAATNASIQPLDVAFDASGDMYISDGRNCRIYRVSAGILTTIAGTGAGSPNACTDMPDGPALSTAISPGSIAVDPVGDLIFSDTVNCTVRRVHVGAITTVAGNGACTYTGGGPALTTAMRPGSIRFDAGGDLYIADATCRVLKLHAGAIATFAGQGPRPGFGYCTYVQPSQRGDGGPAADAYLGAVSGIAIDPLGRVYIADANDCVVRMVTGTTISTFAGTSRPEGSACGDTGDGGPAIDAGLGTPKGLTVDPDGTVYIADLGTSTLGPIRVVAPNDKDDDGFPDWVETGTGTYTGPTDTGTSGVRGDTDSDGCGDAAERRLVPPIDPNDPWDYYSVPVPALISAPDPTTDFRNNVVSAGDGQAVFAYFKVGAVAGSQVYEQDLNQNGIKDGEEYDRSALGVAKSGPPDGVVGAVDAQVAFSQFKSSYAC